MGGKPGKSGRSLRPIIRRGRSSTGLPRDCLLNILCCLEGPDLFTAVRVCWEWNLVGEDPKPWRELCRRKWGASTFSVMAYYVADWKTQCCHGLIYAPPCYTWQLPSLSKKLERSLKAQYTVSILGGFRSGKTALSFTLSGSSDPRLTDDWDPTIEDDITRTRHLSGKQFPFIIRDTPMTGCEYYIEPIVVSSQFHGYAITYSICDRATFDGVALYLKRIRCQSKRSPVLLVGCFLDEEKKRVVGVEEAIAVAVHNGCAFTEVANVPTEGVMMQNTEEAWRALTLMVMETQTSETLCEELEKIADKSFNITDYIDLLKKRDENQ
eukprot:TRINITY_DN3658_c0_g1_i1.p1 TRINITY_DN3658_c0_g1~~TRINITY_DN3658_c0_g1_i1.p1  ORF type:complete len:324 (-),score=31.80 TRINITY_DN3658_c0_g1_i1:55-1026(-)